jgi:hypothetical protein
MKQKARVITTATYCNGTLTAFGSTYPCTLSQEVQYLVDNDELDLAESNELILVPNTNNVAIYNQSDTQTPYLSFTIIGRVIDQPNVELDVVNIIGRVIFENLNHNYLIVRLQYGRNYQTIKLNGRVSDGNAVLKLYDINATVNGKQLEIIDSSLIYETQLIEKPILRKKKEM